MRPTDKIDSALMALVKSDIPWEAKRDALLAFEYVPGAYIDPISDNTAKPILPNSHDELRMARARDLLSWDQYREFLTLLEQQSKSGGKTPAACMTEEKLAAPTDDKGRLAEVPDVSADLPALSGDTARPAVAPPALEGRPSWQRPHPGDYGLLVHPGETRHMEAATGRGKPAVVNPQGEFHTASEDLREGTLKFYEDLDQRAAANADGPLRIVRDGHGRSWIAGDAHCLVAARINGETAMDAEVYDRPALFLAASAVLDNGMPNPAVDYAGWLSAVIGRTPRVRPELTSESTPLDGDD